jgi:hypothetical protein
VFNFVDNFAEDKVYYEIWCIFATPVNVSYEACQPEKITDLRLLVYVLNFSVLESVSVTSVM